MDFELKEEEHMAIEELNNEGRLSFQVENLHFAYGKKPILNGVSFGIKTGEITTFMGANGCGKTTLFNLMTKNLKADAGEITLIDEEWKKSIDEFSLKTFASQVAIVHQSNSFPMDMRVEELVAFGRTPHLRFMSGRSDEDDEIIKWAMTETNVYKYKDREMSRLSGGQRQRVWIAMALAQSPKILFLDEPTTYLDIRYQIEILKLVKRLNEEYNMTIIMVLHDINQAIHYSHNIIGLKGGKIVATGRPQEIMNANIIDELYDISLPVRDIDGRKFVLTV